ncbi:hypothetical protein TNCV_4442081 [Trichonephila clavipes]|nr:hypothetical protein TNCV_4442081 [Trichonephila clavipes]
MASPVIWQANEPGHHDSSLSKGYVEVLEDVNSVMWGRFRHAGTTQNDGTTEKQVLRHEVRAGLDVKISDMPKPPKGLSRSRDSEVADVGGFEEEADTILEKN